MKTSSVLSKREKRAWKTKKKYMKGDRRKVRHFYVSVAIIVKKDKRWAHGENLKKKST